MTSRFQYLSYSCKSNSFYIHKISFQRTFFKVACYSTVLNKSAMRIKNRICFPFLFEQRRRSCYKALLRLIRFANSEEESYGNSVSCDTFRMSHTGVGCQLQPIIFMTGSIISFVTVSVCRWKEGTPSYVTHRVNFQYSRREVMNKSPYA